MSHRPDNEPTALYRLYDADNALLYIGITWHPDFRLEQHMLDKEWIHLVARRAVEWYPDRPAALAAEAVATAAEKPLHDSSWRRSNNDDKPQWKNLDGRKAVIEGLGSEIRQGRYEPGTVLMTGAVAKQFGVARVTASHAMQELERRGLLKFWYHGRFHVLPPKAARAALLAPQGRPLEPSEREPVSEENTRQEALQMSRDLVQFIEGERALAEPGTDTAVRDYVQALLRQYRSDEDARQERISALEAAGRRIVEGGQTGQDEWQIRDWRSGETLASGTGGPEAYDEPAQRLDPYGTWFHIDNLETDPVDVEPVGIPASLADALQDWLGLASTSDEDVAQFVGWSVEDVARHREEA